MFGEQSPRRHFGVVVVGAGPAGLAAANVLCTFMSDFAVIDSGKEVHLRDRHSARDVVAGVGGAGLFSDGKYSFYPASTHLWELNDKEVLRESYQWMASTLGKYGLACPPFPTSGQKEEEPREAWFLKRYPSHYIPLRERLCMTHDLHLNAEGETNRGSRGTCAEDEGGGEFILGYRLEAWRYREERQRFEFTLNRVNAGDQLPGKGFTSMVVTARYAIFAGGRFFPMLMNTEAKCPMQFMRAEVGMRIEDASDNPFWSEIEGLDPKYKFVTSGHDGAGRIEWRTFCCCRQGEVVRTECCGISTWSGRADCPPTRMSNIGFNTRFLGPAGSEILTSLRASRTSLSSFSTSLRSLLAAPSTELEALFGTETATRMRQGVILLCEKFPSLVQTGTARTIGPTIEGVGQYPKTDGDLKLSNGWRGWVAGDAQGTFRGIVAAMVSGAYAAHKVKQEYTTCPDPETEE